MRIAGVYTLFPFSPPNAPRPPDGPHDYDCLTWARRPLLPYRCGCDVLVFEARSRFCFSTIAATSASNCFAS